MKIPPRWIVTAVRIDGSVETMNLDSRKADLDAYDRLGPLSRAVIDESPIDIEVRLLLRAYRDRYRDTLAPPDPRSPDEQLASFLADAIRRKVPTFKPLRRRRTGNGDRGHPGAKVL